MWALCAHIVLAFKIRGIILTIFVCVSRVINDLSIFGLSLSEVEFSVKTRTPAG